MEPIHNEDTDFLIQGHCVKVLIFNYLMAQYSVKILIQAIDGIQKHYK